MNHRRTVLVTGASSGIGEAISDAQVAQGNRVVGIGRDFSKCRIDDGLFERVALDLEKLGDLPGALQAIAAGHDFDALVLNAGAGRFGGLEEFSYGQIDAQVALNLTSHVYVTRALLPALKKRGGGDCIFIGSEAALAGGARGALYSACKSALRGFAQALRAECAAAGVRVSIINPGMVRSPFFDELDFAPGEAPENYIEPADVAAAVDMILSARPGTVFDEINLSPLKKVIRKK